MSGGLAGRALILAPRGRDARVASDMLAEAGVTTKICKSLPDLVGELRSGAGFALVTDESLRTPDLRPLSDWLAEQPEWSDFPFVLLTERGGGLERNPAARRHLAMLGNVTFVERPFHPTTLVSLVQAALRARRRQYEARDRLVALNESERQFRTLADSIPTLCWMARADGHIFWYNQRWYDYTGATPSDMEGWGWRSVHAPETLPAVMERWTASLRTGELFEMVFPLRAASGAFSPFLTRVQPVRDAGGEIVRWFGTNTDISVQQQAQETLRSVAADLETRVAERTAALQQSERRSRGLFETSYALQALLSPDGAVLDANTALLDAMDATLAEVRGLPFWSTPWFAATPGMPERIQSVLTEVANSQVVREEVTLALPTGRRTFDFSFRPMSGDRGEIVGIVPEAVELTARRQVEEALRQSQKLEAIGQLTGGVAHDFNNLLTPITGALDILQRRYLNADSDPRAARLLQGALQSAERAKTLVQRLLGFARRQALETQAVDLGALLEGMRDLLKSSVGASIDMKLSCEPRLPPTLADPNQLELALLNLVVNARDAMPAGGAVTVEARRGEAVAAAPGLPPRDFVVLSVSDTGAGMDAETLARAVEPFFSTKPTGQGTGLGLSLVHGLAAQLGGAFQMESAPGRGTCARLYLPTTDGALAKTLARPDARPRQTGRPFRILLVDDENLVRQGTAEMLRELGHDVVEATGGAEALDKAGEHLEFDLLMTDYKMPRMNGGELARRMLAIKPDLPVLLMSGYTGSADDVPECRQLRKPFRQSELAEAIHSVIG